MWQPTGPRRAVPKLPLLRDVDGLLLPERGKKRVQPSGPTNGPARRSWADPARRPLPEDFQLSGLYRRLDPVSVQIESSMGAVPVLAEAGLAKVTGRIPYAPGGKPLLGPDARRA